jgi:hypothetical protein
MLKISELQRELVKLEKFSLYPIVLLRTSCPSPFALRPSGQQSCSKSLSAILLVKIWLQILTDPFMQYAG